MSEAIIHTYCQGTNRGNTQMSINASQSQTTRYQSAKSWKRWQLTASSSVLTPTQIKPNNSPDNKEQQPIKKWFTSVEGGTTLLQACPVPQIKKKKKNRHKTKGKDNSKYKPTHTLKLASLNCPGIAAPTAIGAKKRRTVREFCRQHRIDVLALQETHSTQELESLSGFYPHKTYSSKVSPNKGGVAFVIFNPKFRY
jgi:hypothetical protein